MTIEEKYKKEAIFLLPSHVFEHLFWAIITENRFIDKELDEDGIENFVLRDAGGKWIALFYAKEDL